MTDICRKAGISQATYFNWKKKYDGLLPTDMRLKLLEDENTKLRKLVADLWLDREMLQDVIRRKLLGLLASASWSTRCVASGMSQSGGPCSPTRSDPVFSLHFRCSSKLAFIGSKGNHDATRRKPK